MHVSKAIRGGLLVSLLALAAGSAAAQEQQGRYTYSAGYDANLRQGQASALPPQDVLERVFFAFDSAEISPEARTKLNELADMVEERNIEQVNIIGHTDTAGPADYNLRLSQRRAEAVSQALTSLGVANQVIDLAWEGETDPLVETGDGVPLQENRRVHITIPAADGFQSARAE